MKMNAADWVHQVQVPCGRYCGANLLCGLPVKDDIVCEGFLKFFCCVSYSAFCHYGAVNSEGGKLGRREH